MKKPEYTPQLIHKDTLMYVCKVCGSYIAIRGLHDAWHKEQAIPSSEKEWGGVA